MDMVAMGIQMTHQRLAHLFEIIDTIEPHERCTTVNK
jgi:hypothetical protein